MTYRWQVAASTLGCPGETLDAVIATLNTSGVRQVELRAAPDALVHVGLPPGERTAVRERLQAAGIAVLALASGVRIAAAGGDEEVVADLHEHLQLAADLGARFVRVFPGLPVHEGPFDQVPAAVEDRAAGDTRAAHRLDAATGRATRLGVRVALETHDSHPRGADLRGILDRLAPGTRGTVGVIWDLLHPWRVGEPPTRTWHHLAPFLLEGRGYVQIKDVASPTVLTPVLQGSGRVPLAQALELLEQGGYRGPLSLEWERTWYPAIPPLSAALPEAVRAVADVAPR